VICAVAVVLVALAGCAIQDSAAPSAAPTTSATDDTATPGASPSVDPDTAVTSTATDPAGGTCLAGDPDCLDDPSNPNATPPGPPTPEPTFVAPRGGLEDLREVPWDEVDVAGDDRTVTVRWTSGVEPCHALDRIDVASTADAVTLTVIEGTVASDEPIACIEIALLEAHRLVLDEPIGPRSILDGADPRQSGQGDGDR
jgi:hypothetical protein